MKEEECLVCYYAQRRCTHPPVVDFSIEALMGRGRPPRPAHPAPLRAQPLPPPPPMWMNDPLLLSACFFKFGYYQPAGPLISSGPLHGGFKEGAPPSAPSLSMEQTPYTRYQYHQPPQVLHYGNGFGGPHAHAGYSAPGAHYGPVDVCYGGARPPAPPPSCYPPPPAHRQTKQNNTQVSPSPAGGEAYAPQYYQPCYQHTHAAPPRPYIDAAYQGCPCPMQSCPKNGLTGPATGSLSTSGGPATCGAGGALAGEPPRASNEALRAPDTKNQFYKEGEGRGGCCAVAVNPSLGVIAPEAPGPPSPARGSAGASVPQPPDPHLGLRLLPAMVNPPRRARLGKAMARKSIGADDAPGHTMLLMCHTPQTSVSPPAALTPLGIMTDKAISEVKNEVDSGDDVILIDSPRSKIPPIEVSSSEENCNDSKSEKDCVVSVRKEDKSSVELSADTKKENAAVISSPMKKSMLDVQALKEHNVDKSVSICDGLKKSSDKPKSGIKRRCSQPKMEIDLDIDDNLAANGIGEHVKLQKRQKVSNDVQNLKKTLVTGSYKDLIKKPEKVFKLNNGKRQLNTIKVDKCKSSNRLLSLLDSDKLKKVSSKRKSSSPILEATVNKKKKYNSSLLKSADKKLSARLAELTEKVHDIPRKIVPPVIVTKAKSATILDNLMTKNITMDRVIESVGKNAGDEPATILATKSATKTPVNSLIVQKNRKASTPEIIPTKSRTVLNINNNVVKKALETEKQKVEVKSRRNSKSPAILKVDKKDVSAKKCEKVPKVESKGKKVNKSQIGVASKGGSAKRKSKNSVEEDLALVPAGDGSLPLGRCLGTPKWSNGWTWEGEPTQAKVYVNNEDLGVMARCWSGMRHARAGDAVRRGDCVLLRAGPKRTEAPFVARVAQLYESPIDGEMMVSLLWYYRPEHTERGRQPDDCTEEVFASRHRDANSVACIEDKCYVLTFNEYCRYRKQLKASEENVRSGPSIVPRMPTTEITQGVATNDGLVPPNTSPDLVLFCRRVYDFRLKKIMKNPPY